MEREDPASIRIADGCALHGGEPFTAICRKCGTYMCRRCAAEPSRASAPPGALSARAQDGEQARFDTCGACRALPPTGAEAGSGSFPFRRDGIVWGAFLRFCFDVYRRGFGLVTLALIAICAAALLAHGLGTTLIMLSAELLDPGLLWPLLGAAEVLLMCALLLGMLKLSLQLVRGQPASLSLLLSGVDRLGSLLLVSMITAAVVGGAELLTVLPIGLGFAFLDASVSLGDLLLVALGVLVALCVSIYVLLGLVFATIELVSEPTIGTFTALGNAWRIAHGERLTVGFGMFLIGVLGTVGGMFCGIGALFTLGYASVLFAALYLALRNGAPNLRR